MNVRLTAVAVWVAAWLVAPPTPAADPLTLDDAMARVAANHPDLRLGAALGELLAAGRDAAALRPALTAGVEAENALGSGGYGGLDSAEFTLSLASVLERGGKLAARQALAQGRLDQLAIEQELRQLDLLAEVARRYLTLGAASRQRDIAGLEIGQRRSTVAAAQARFEAGASPQSVVLTAQAALARAELAEARARQQWQAARQHLAALWGERNPQFDIPAVDPLRLPVVEDAAALAALLARTPQLARFAGQRRIGEARLQLARTEGTTDIQWQLGVRRLEAGDDVALMAGFSVPLGSRQRAEPGIRAAAAELAQLDIEHESAELALYSTLVDAHGRYRVAQLEVERLQAEVLPALQQAEAGAGRAYLAGALGYLDWAQLQSELTATRRQQLEAALDAQRALIEMQRLTGQPFVVGNDARGITP